MGMGVVTHIYIAPEKARPVQRVERVEALADQGLRGDRYTLAKNRRAPDYQVTLVEIENLEAFTRRTHLALTPEMTRRNIVTRGVRLNDLVGRRFRAGEALLEGLELCEPCKLLARITHREVLQQLAGRGGLRARIVEGGAIRVGDPVGESERTPFLAYDQRLTP
jgi:MOSC domain-containing protein YiiM